MITYADLITDIANEAAGARSIIELQPAGGAGDKIFPPTYAGGIYATELRRNPETGETSNTVLLDSVASQANRAELALLKAWRKGAIAFPLPRIDFSAAQALVDFDELTALETPHRLADAIFRDSEINGVLFRRTDAGKAITDATPRNCAALYRECPTALVWGMWDSTGPKGGLGSKFQRAYCSEIVGHDAQEGVKTASRLDPLQIETLPDENLVYSSADPADVWTPYKEDAARDSKNNPKLASRGGISGRPGQPSKINHGNIAPSVESAGGVTISKAVQTAVISYGALAKLNFRGYTLEQENAARAVLAALGIAALAYSIEDGYDLRSRCFLIPTETPKLQVLARNGAILRTLEINAASAARTFNDAVAAATQLGVKWNDEGLRLTPSNKLLKLVEDSRANSANNDAQ